MSSQAIMADTAEAELVKHDVDSLVRQYARFVYRVAYSVLRNHQDAEDAAQETFVKVWRSRDKLEAVREPRLWLARIAWRVAVDRARKRPEQPLDEAADPVAHEASLDEQLAGEQLQQLMQSLIAGLPRELREVITLSTAEDMSAADIGEVLGIREGTVRTRLFRAREMLRERLAARIGKKSSHEGH